MKIIYCKDKDATTSEIVVITPNTECDLTIEQIAQKDVPLNTPYKIVANNVIPSDRTFRDAWTVNVADLDSGSGADFGEGSTNEPPAEWYPEKHPEPEGMTQEQWDAYLAEQEESTDD